MRLGKISENVLKRSVLRQIKNNNQIETPNFVTCMQEACVACSEGELAQTKGAEPFMTMPQLLIKTANNLAAMGATPKSCMLTIVMPTDAEEAVLKALMQQANDTCNILNMNISGGQTRVSAGVTMPFVTVAGMGELRISGVMAKSSKALPIMDVVITKWIGLQGTALLAKRNETKLLTRYPAYLVEEAKGFDKFLSILPEADIAARCGAYAMQDVSEGGIFAALWELAERTGVGLTIDMKKLPLRQETVEVCELCDANPYELMSGGALLLFTENGEALVEALIERGIPAGVVGQTTNTKDRILQNEDEIRYMDKPKQDAIYENRE